LILAERAHLIIAGFSVLEQKQPDFSVSFSFIRFVGAQTVITYSPARLLELARA
jgi:hypothetical protein